VLIEKSRSAEFIIIYHNSHKPVLSAPKLNL
jgi:hypothetical protein